MQEIKVSKCRYCGKKNIYFLCDHCDKLRKERKIVQCLECGTWGKVDKECACCKRIRELKHTINMEKSYFSNEMILALLVTIFLFASIIPFLK